MARITDITLIKQPKQQVISTRKTINFMKDFSDFTPEVFVEIMAYVETLDSLLGGEPFACFHNMDLENLDVEVGFPIADSINGQDEIKISTIPSEKVVTAIDQGPYESLDPSLNDLFIYIKNNNLEILGPIYYHYLNNTNCPEKEYLTKIIIPVK